MSRPKTGIDEKHVRFNLISESTEIQTEKPTRENSAQESLSTEEQITPFETKIDEVSRLRSLTPNLYDLDIRDFQEGLGVDNATFLKFLDVLYDHVEETGILVFQFPEGPVAQAVIQQIAEKLLQYIEEVKPAGFPVTPDWYMAEWVKRIIGNLKGDEEAIKRKELDRGYRNLRQVVTGRPSSGGGPSTGQFSGTGGLALPSPALRPHSSILPPLRRDQSAFPADSFTGRVLVATIDQCIVSVEVWRLGTRVEHGPYEVAASRFLKLGSEPFIHSNYLFNIFIEIYEDKINADKSQDSVEIKYGRLGYFNTDGDHLRVVDQDSFEVALNRLFLARGRDNILKFIFQPESEDKKIERKAREEEEKAAARALEDDDDARIDRLAVEFEESARTEEGGKAPVAAAPQVTVNDLLHDRLNLPQSGGSAIPAPKSPSTSPRSNISGVLSPATNETSLQTPVKREQEQREEIFFGERSPSAQSSRSRSSSVRTGVQKALQLKKRETDAEREERWQNLFHIEQKFAFTRGGDEEEPDIDKYRPDHDADIEGEGEVADEEEEEEEESETQEADRIVAKLQDLQNLSELTQLEDPNGPGDNARWIDCCRMFSIDPGKTALSEVVLVAGLKTKIYQYQAFGVYWQMLTSRRLGGGFVADSMGLGKTLSFLSFFVVERQLSCLWAEVEKSRKAKDGKHLQPEEHNENDICPSRPKLGWVSCPCASSSPTSKLAPKSGVRLSCVPDALVRSWWKEWKTHVDTTETVLGLTIVVDYKGAFDRRMSQADMLASSSNARNKTRLESVKSGGQRADTPHERQSGWLVLTTAKTFKDWIKKFEYKGQVQGKDGKWKTGTRHQIVFGLAMIDESHEEYFKQTGRGKVLADLPSVNQPFLWGYSGTPFSQTPRGLEGVLWAIEQHFPSAVKGESGWHNHPFLQQFEYRKLDKICKDFDNEFKRDRPDQGKVDQILADFKPFLLNFVIRRTAETLWFGHRLIKLKQHCHQDLIVAAASKRRAELQNERIATYEAGFQFEKDQALAEIQERWDNFPDKRRTEIRPMKLGFNTLCRLQWRLRVLATFPFLIKLADSKDENSKLNLTPEEALSFVRPGEKIKENPYFKHIRNIVEDSPKCLWLSFFIRIIDAQTDYKGDEQKLIIMTAFPQVAFILKMFLLKYFPKSNDRVGLILPRMKARDKTEALEAFTDAHDDNGNRKQKRNNKILIGTTRLIGTGLQLTRSCNVVLMEPDYEFIKELQGYGRVHRIGQKNNSSFSYRLIDPTSEIERAILKKQQDRKEVVGRALSDSELKMIEDSILPEPQEDEVLSQSSTTPQ